MTFSELSWDEVAHHTYTWPHPNRDALDWAWCVLRKVKRAAHQSFQTQAALDLAYAFASSPHGPTSWQTRLTEADCLAALERHADRLLEDPGGVDADSKLPHRCHVLARCAMVVWFRQQATWHTR